jgi:nitroreductase
VPVLALGIVSLKFAKNGKDNRAAVHDLGLAAGNLVVEATARGLRVHQMIGILPDKARGVFGIPEGYEAWTGIAIGYEGDPATLPDNLKQRDLANGGIRHPSWRSARTTGHGRQLPGHLPL